MSAGEAALAGLLDVDGVVGAFVTGRDGDVRHRDVPATIGPLQLRRTAARLSRVLACARLCDLEVETCTLKLGDLQLRVEELKDGLLCVMASASVNPRVLRAALDLARVVLERSEEPAPERGGAAHASRTGELADVGASGSAPAIEASRSEWPESDPTRRDVPAYDDEETTLRCDLRDATRAIVSRS